MGWIALVLFCFLVFLSIRFILTKKKLTKEIKQKDEVEKQSSERVSVLVARVNELAKYQGIIDVNAEIDTKLAQAKEIIRQAEDEARQIAGNALDAQANEKQLRASIKAMENIISGYGDQYLIPPQSLLDELAEQYDFKEAGQQLKRAKDRIKVMIEEQTASACDYAEANRRESALRFVLDAFNGKVDTILAKVKHDNYGKLRQRIIDAYSIVNINGQAFRNARITPEYLEAIQEELKWAVAVHELLIRDKEEQKRIKQQIQEEERAQREYERALKEAEKEEKLLQEAMEKARQEMASASAERKAVYEARLREMEEKLRIAEEKSQRALSMAQQTKSGHVYVISNIGSFGDDVLKIGMTRRLEPRERVEELSNASVPFPFDVHAMIFSEDAPRLESDLHNKFIQLQMNKVNPRKEFFRVQLANVRAVCEREGIQAHWTMQAEALEYRESVAIQNKQAV